jgi:hypothetical protein
MKLNKQLAGSIGALLLALGVAHEAALASQGKQKQSKTASDKTYEKAKQEMPGELYMSYRILDRIVSANPTINQQASIAIRSVDDSSCKQMLGDSPLCALITQLPDVKKEDSFVIWALQVTSATSGTPNAYAYSSNNRIIINKPLENAFTGDIEAKSCVIAHEMAHIQNEHLAKRKAAMNEWNTQAATQISSAIKNAHKAQNSAKFWTALAMLANATSAGLNSGLGNYGAAASANFNNQLLVARFQADSSAGQIMVSQLMQAAQSQAPDVFNALSGMQGLSGSIVQRTMKDVYIYLGEVNENAMALSRQHELEADQSAVEYIANAGINPQACLRVMDRLHRDDPQPNALITSSHPGQSERSAAIREAIEAHKNNYLKAKTQPAKPGALAYTYDRQLELATVYPRGHKAAAAAANPTATVDTFLGK